MPVIRISGKDREALARIERSFKRGHRPLVKDVQAPSDPKCEASLSFESHSWMLRGLYQEQFSRLLWEPRGPGYFDKQGYGRDEWPEHAADKRFRVNGRIMRPRKQ